MCDDKITEMSGEKTAVVDTIWQRRQEGHNHDIVNYGRMFHNTPTRLFSTNHAWFLSKLKSNYRYAGTLNPMLFGSYGKQEKKEGFLTTAQRGYNEGGHRVFRGGGSHKHQEMWEGWDYNSSGAQICCRDISSNPANTSSVAIGPPPNNNNNNKNIYYIRRYLTALASQPRCKKLSVHDAVDASLQASQMFPL